MAPTNRVHYTAELKKKARILYFDPVSEAFRSYKKVAKKLGIPRFQTVAEWAKQQKWHEGPAQKPTRFLTDLDSTEMFELQADQWDQIAERSLNLLLTSTDHNLLGKALTIFKDALAQQKDLHRRIQSLRIKGTKDSSSSTSKSDDSSDTGSKIFPFERSNQEESQIG